MSIDYLVHNRFLTITCFQVLLQSKYVAGCDSVYVKNSLVSTPDTLSTVVIPIRSSCKMFKIVTKTRSLAYNINFIST